MTDSPADPPSGTAFPDDVIPGARVLLAHRVRATCGTPAAGRPIGNPSVVVGRAVILEPAVSGGRGLPVGHGVHALSTG